MNKRTTPLLLMLLLLASCYSPYNELIRPLQGVDAGCYCRFKSMAFHYYDCQISDLKEQGITGPAAQQEAIRRTHLLIAETQLNMSEQDRKRLCNCLQLKQKGYFN